MKRRSADLRKYVSLLFGIFSGLRRSRGDIMTRCKGTQPTLSFNDLHLRHDAGSYVHKSR